MQGKQSLLGAFFNGLRAIVMCALPEGRDVVVDVLLLGQAAVALMAGECSCRAALFGRMATAAAGACCCCC
jgi:hypothetical protein